MAARRLNARASCIFLLSLSVAMERPHQRRHRSSRHLPSIRLPKRFSEKACQAPPGACWYGLANRRGKGGANCFRPRRVREIQCMRSDMSERPQVEHTTSIARCNWQPKRGPLPPCSHWDAARLLGAIMDRRSLEDWSRDDALLPPLRVAARVTQIVEFVVTGLAEIDYSGRRESAI
jgi:hypothetical protein